MAVVKCPECGRPIPEDFSQCPRCFPDEEGRPWERSSGRRPRSRRATDPFDGPTDFGLTDGAKIGYFFLFLPIPAVNVIVSSVLYYAWRGSYPKAASQINTIGFVVFGIQLILMCVLCGGLS